MAAIRNSGVLRNQASILFFRPSPNQNAISGTKELFMRTILFAVSVARIRDGETAVRSRRDLDVVRCSFVRNSCHKRASRSQVSDERFRRIVVSGINRVVQLPEVFQPRRFLERLESGGSSAFFPAVIHYC